MNHKKAYTLRTHGIKKERHIFVGAFTPDGVTDCNMSSQSACKEVAKADCSRSVDDFQCKNEQEARDLCAKLGRSVCANCIQELYKTI